MPVLWYWEPAADWEHALPLGNGFLGAMCFGGALQDRWFLNDGTVYSGGFIDLINPDAADGIQTVRRLLAEGRLAEAEETAEEAVMSTPEGERAYEPLCELIAQFKTPRHPRYLPPIQTLWLDGRIREWLSPDKVEAKPGHRHISYLFALYPGKQITTASPAVLTAAHKTLELRLANGGGQTGWSHT